MTPLGLCRVGLLYNGVLPSQLFKGLQNSYYLMFNCKDKVSITYTHIGSCFEEQGNYLVVAAPRCCPQSCSLVCITAVYIRTSLQQYFNHLQQIKLFYSVSVYSIVSFTEFLSLQLIYNQTILTSLGEFEIIKPWTLLIDTLILSLIILTPGFWAYRST